MTTVTFGPTALAPSASSNASEASGSIPTLNWASPWKANVLHGLDRLHDPTYGIPPGSSIASLMSAYTSTATAIAQRVAFAIRLLECGTGEPVTSVSLVGAGHVAQSILAQLPESIAVRQSSRLPLATTYQSPRTTSYAFTCDISSALSTSPVAILTVPPHSLAPLIDLHAHAMQEAKLILVVCAGIAPLVVRRMYAGRGFADVGKRVVVVAPGDDVARDVGRAVLGVLVGVDVYPAKWDVRERKARQQVAIEAKAEGGEETGRRSRVIDEEAEEEARRVWPGMAAGKIARLLLENLVGDGYDPPLMDSKVAWDNEVETQMVQDAIRKVFVDKMDRKDE